MAFRVACIRQQATSKDNTDANISSVLYFPWEGYLLTEFGEFGRAQ